MVTKSTSNTKAKKKRESKKEDHRQKQPCTWCGEPLNTAAKIFGHTKAVCQTKQKENKKCKGKAVASE